MDRKKGQRESDSTVGRTAPGFRVTAIAAIAMWALFQAIVKELPKESGPWKAGLNYLLSGVCRWRAIPLLVPFF